MGRLLKVAITGPESTGKSLMAQQLADHFISVWVPEYARLHLLKLDRPYNYDDVLEIAQKQVATEKVFESLAKKVLFSDTELLVTKIWCEDKYSKCHPWILKKLKKQHYDLYLLMDIDLPWEYDPMREDESRRKFLFDWYQKELIKYKCNYRIISGSDELRLNNAIREVEELLLKNQK